MHVAELDLAQIALLPKQPEVQEALHHIAESIAKAAASKAPVKSGDLQRSIKAIPDPNVPGGYRVVMLDYGMYAELGTRREAARPFLRPAADRYH